MKRSGQINSKNKLDAVTTWIFSRGKCSSDPETGALYNGMEMEKKLHNMQKFKVAVLLSV